MAKAMFVRYETPKEVADKMHQMIEMARESGKVKKGTNEVTKLIERGEAKFVIMAEDVQPPEILAHIPLLCEEKNIPYGYVATKQELGFSCGLEKPTASVAIIDPGKGKPQMDSIIEQIKELKK